MNDDRLKKLDESAAEVSRRALIADAVHEAERDAARALLERAIDMLVKGPDGRRGTLRAIGTTPTVAYSNVGQGNEVTESGEDRVVLLSGETKPVSTNERAAAGTYSGKALWLTERGVLQKATYAGSWAAGQNPSAWMAGWNVTRETLTARAAVAQFDVEECIDTISQKLDAYLNGNATRRTATAERRAAKLRAVVTLLGEEPRR